MIAGDIATLSRRLIQEACWRDLLSTQQIQTEQDRWRIPQVHWTEQHAVLEAAGASISIFVGFRRGQQWKWNSSRIIQLVINWATHHEGLSLAAGRKLFGDRAVLGGFVNGRKACLLYQGEREAIEQETRRLVAEAGSRGLILGADCTVPDDSHQNGLDWVRQQLYCKKKGGDEKGSIYGVSW